MAPAGETNAKESFRNTMFLFNQLILEAGLMICM